MPRHTRTSRSEPRRCQRCTGVPRVAAADTAAAWGVPMVYPGVPRGDPRVHHGTPQGCSSVCCSYPGYPRTPLAPPALRSAARSDYTSCHTAAAPRCGAASSVAWHRVSRRQSPGLAARTPPPPSAVRMVPWIVTFFCQGRTVPWTVRPALAKNAPHLGPSCRCSPVARLRCRRRRHLR